jgi:hypothetical protein
MSLVSVGPNQGTETVTRDTTYKSAGHVLVQVRNRRQPCLRGNLRAVLQARSASGMTVPRHERRSMFRSTLLRMSGIELRVVVNCYDAADQLIFVTPEIFVTGTGTGTFHNAAFSLPQLAVDCYAQVSVTNGSAGDSMASTTFWVDQVSFKVGTVTTPTPPTLVAGFPVKLTPGAATATYTQSITVPHGLVNGYLLIEHHYDDQARPINGPGAGSKPTFNSSVMTLVSKPTPGSGRPNVEAWGMLNPNPGGTDLTANVAVTNSLSVQGELVIYLFEHVDQTVPVGNGTSGPAPVSTNSANSIHPTVSINAPVTDYVIGAISISATSVTTLSMDTGPTSRYNDKRYSTFGIHAAGATRVGTGTSQTFGWQEVECWRRTAVHSARDLGTRCRYCSTGAAYQYFRSDCRR